MKLDRRWVQPRGVAVFRKPDGRAVELPVVQGILKHLGEDELGRLLANPDVALKYTLEALRIAPWPVLRHFPRGWLLECLPKARLPEGRARAVEFMLAAG
jgi:hypothetical protein